MLNILCAISYAQYLILTPLPVLPIPRYTQFIRTSALISNPPPSFKVLAHTLARTIYPQYSIKEADTAL